MYKGTPIDSYKIVKFLDENQDVVMLNSSIKQRLHNDLKDKVDPSSGIYLNVKIGDYIRTGEEIGVIFNSDEKKLDENLLSFQSCFKISNQLVELNNLIIDYS